MLRGVNRLIGYTLVAGALLVMAVAVTYVALGDAPGGLLLASGSAGLVVYVVRAFRTNDRRMGPRTWHELLAVDGATSAVFALAGFWELVAPPEHPHFPALLCLALSAATAAFIIQDVRAMCRGDPYRNRLFRFQRRGADSHPRDG